MSVVEDDDNASCDIPPSEEFDGDQNAFDSDQSINMEENEFEKNEIQKGEERYHHSNGHRPMRSMRHQNSMQYRYRQPYQGFRGRMGGNHYMRPNRNGPPYDGYGPPMGMPRGPPRHFPPRYPPSADGHQDENMDGSVPPYPDVNASGEYDGPPNMPPGMRPHCPSPYMMGPHGGPPPHGPPPHGPYGGPPGPPFNPHGPSMVPPGGPYNCPGPNYGGPNQARPPFTGPPQPGSQNFGGPPPNTNGPDFNTPPLPYGQPPPFGGQFPGPDPTGSGPPMPPFSAPSGPPGMPPGPPAVPPPGPPVSSATPPVPPNMPPGLVTAPSVAQAAPPVPPPGILSSASPGNPSGPPTSNTPLLQTPFTAPEGQTGTNFPPFPPVPPISVSNNPVPSDTPPTSTPVSEGQLPPTGPLLHPPPTQAAPAFPFANGPPLYEVPPQQFSMPMGYPGQPGAPHPMMNQPPIHQPLTSTPNIPLHMMPPPMPHMSAMPPSMPPYRPPMHFMPPGMQVNSMSQPVPPIAPPKPTEEIWVENLTAEGKAYYYNMRTRETRWDRPDGVTVVRQGEVDTSKSTTNTTVSPFSTSTAQQPQKPPDVAVWTEYHNPEGKAYYHNSKTGETTWEKPEALVKWEDTQNKTTVDEPVNTVSSQPEPTTQQVPISVEKPNLMNNVTMSSAPVASNNETVSTKQETTEKLDNTSESTGSKENQPKTQKDSSRPVSSTAVPGTPWCVVWTGDGRAFFFNPSQRLSVWERPEELKGRTDVDRLLEKQTSEPSATNNSTVVSNAGDDGESATKKPRLDEDEPGTTKGVEVINGASESDIDMEKSNTTPDKIAVGMEAAKEAEERAARERAVQPLEVRVKRFREMLVEMQVSAFSTWEKELHKIVFDPRYLLLASKERKQTFESFVKERADEERREKKSKMKERKEKFNELLDEATLTSKSSFSDFSVKYAKDDRFKGIEKSRERESLFQDYVSDLRKREKEGKHRDKEKVKSDFIQLLKEQKGLSRHSHWSDVKKKIDSDSRYKAVDSSSRREDWFRDYVKKIDETPSREDSYSRKEREKKERQEASIKEREREVKDSLSSSMKDRDKEREQQLRAEQEHNFKALLVELIREPTVSWKEAKKILRKDDRWEMISDVLQRTERDEMFRDHLDALTRKRDMKGQTDNDSREKRSSESGEREESFDRRSKSSGRR